MGVDVELNGIPVIERKVGDPHAGELAGGLAEDIPLGLDLDAVVADGVLEVVPRAVSAVEGVVVLGVGVALVGGDVGDGDGGLAVAGHEVGAGTLVALELKARPAFGAKTTDIEVGVERAGKGGLDLLPLGRQGQEEGGEEELHAAFPTYFQNERRKMRGTACAMRDCEW